MPARIAGQSVVELALTIGVLLLIMLGGLAALQTITAQYSVAQAARAAAHEAALVGGDGGPAGEVVRAASLVLNAGLGTRADRARIQITCAAPCRRYSPITVTVTYRDELWAPIGPFDALHARVVAVRALELDRDGAPIDVTYPGLR